MINSLNIRGSKISQIYKIFFSMDIIFYRSGTNVKVNS